MNHARTLLCLTVFLAAPSLRAAERIEYNQDIRPILAENCFACHGPDSAARKAGLRLDRRELAVSSGAIFPGDAKRSKLIQRVFAVDSSRPMPPPSSHKQLSRAQIGLLPT